jgi:hypothetical protein
MTGPKKKDERDKMYWYDISGFEGEEIADVLIL